jgi:hypothetical protein
MLFQRRTDDERSCRVMTWIVSTLTTTTNTCGVRVKQRSPYKFDMLAAWGKINIIIMGLVFQRSLFVCIALNSVLLLKKKFDMLHGKNKNNYGASSFS